MTSMLSRAAVAACLSMAAAPAHAGELFGGLFVHDVKTPLTLSGVESGVDAQLGWRGGRIGKTPLQPYGLVSVNSADVKTTKELATLAAQNPSFWRVEIERDGQRIRQFFR